MSKNTVKPVSVAIIDDDKPYRDFLKDLLEQNINIRLYGEYSNGNMFLNELKNPFKPDVCLMDIVLPDTLGTDLAVKVKEIIPEVSIILMTASPSSKTLTQARAIKADYVEKGTVGEKLIDKIVLHQTIIKNEQIISLKMKGDNIHEGMAHLSKELEDIQCRVSLLSKGQRKVLKLKQSGKTKCEIAELLDLSPKTVQNHLNLGEKRIQLKSEDHLFKYLVL